MSRFVTKQKRKSKSKTRKKSNIRKIQEEEDDINLEHSGWNPLEQLSEIYDIPVQNKKIKVSFKIYMGSRFFVFFLIFCC